MIERKNYFNLGDLAQSGIAVEKLFGKTKKGERKKFIG